MENRSRKFEVRANILGGGLAFRKGEVVDESQLKGYAESLKRENGIVELRSPSQQPRREKALVCDVVA